MKVGILTWYKAINHGAVLQTFASCKILESLDCEPVVLDYNWNLDESNKKDYGSIIKKINLTKILWKLKVKRFFKKKSEVFNNFRKKYLPLGKEYKNEENLDAVYIGSDMVFDLHEGYNPFMYGINVPTNYIFSYAASFGYTNLKKFKNNQHADEVKNAISKLNSIGYRDINTKEICEFCTKKVPMVENIDPVLAYGFETEIESWDTKKWEKRDYILVYAYESTMNDIHEVEKIKNIAKKEGLEVISCGYYHKWCDECIVADPKEFIEMIKYAKYVVTDTFHGTIFSLLMHKKICVIIRNNGFKIRHLLETCNMTSVIANNSNEIMPILNREIDYSFFDSWRLKESKNSIMFIKNNIQAAKRYI